MAAPRAAYVAIRVIEHNGVRAYNPGDPVDASAVEGEHAWLTAGEDVEPSGTMQLERPPEDAGQARWAAYAESKGMPRDQAQGMSRDDLITATADQPATGEPAAAEAAPRGAGKR